MTDKQYNRIIVNYEVIYMSDSISAKAVVATGTMDEIILEKFLTKSMPKSNKFCLKQVYENTGFKFDNLRKYVYSDLFTIGKDTIDITNDMQLLSDKSREYIEQLIKKVIRPAKYENSKFNYMFAKIFDNSYFTDEEQKFIELITKEVFSIIDYNELSRKISIRDLFGFHYLNRPPFIHTARQVYNDILQKKIHAGDNIMEYIKTNLTDIQVTEKLETSCKYDCFFDNNGILKCDLVTNRNILIKNFLSMIFYGVNDNQAKTILLLKLNSKYPFLISENILCEYNRQQN